MSDRSALWILVAFSFLLSIYSVYMSYQANSGVSVLMKNFNAIDKNISEIYNKIEDIREEIRDLEVNYEIRFVEIDHKISEINESRQKLMKNFEELESEISLIKNNITELKSLIGINVPSQFEVTSLGDVKSLIDSGDARNITPEELYESMISFLTGRVYNGSFITFDTYYLAYDENILRKILLGAHNYLSSKEYLRDIFDCDDYAIVTIGIIRNNLPGAACFLASIDYESSEEGHMQVLCVDKNGNVIPFEPQTGEFVLLGGGEISSIRIFG